MNDSHLHRGTHVSHRLYGNGTILEEWGSWFACRSCYVEVPIGAIHCSECIAKNKDSLDPKSYPLQVSGKGTYDVLFQDRKIHSINSKWLVVKHGLIAA